MGWMAFRLCGCNVTNPNFAFVLAFNSNAEIFSFLFFFLKKKASFSGRKNWLPQITSSITSSFKFLIVDSVETTTIQRY